MHLRLFCRYVCPLGLLQSLVRGFRAPRRVCTRLPETKQQMVCRWLIVILYIVSFFVPALYIVKPFVDPYSILCRAVCVTFFSPEIDAAIAAVAYAPIAVIIALSLFTRGRFWCNWVCPWGSVLHLFSKCFPKGDQVGKGCDKCGKCGGAK